MSQEQELYPVTDSTPRLETGASESRIRAGKPKTIFSFSAKTAAAAPDDGSAIALLGIALTGIEDLRRKLRRAT
jgi:hypothetical protein